MSDTLKAFQKLKKKLVKEYHIFEKKLSSIRHKHEATLAERRDALAEVGIIIVGGKAKAPKPIKVKAKRKMSKAGRAAIAKAQKARWAKVKAAGK